MMRRIFILVFAAGSAYADPATRLYEQGKYAEAFERFKQAAEKHPENWPLLYDLGVSAYKAGRPDEAAKAFERAIGSKDKTLQEHAFYNLGNSYYRIGEIAEKQAPPQALAFYEKSLKGFESAAALDPNDVDAKFNADLAKNKIEELKKKQEQQDQQQQQKEKDKQGKDQGKEKDQQQSQEQQSQDQDKKDGQDQKQQQEEQKKEQKQEQAEEKKENAQPQPQEQAAQPNNLEKLQATALLDNLREDERNWNFFPELQMDLKDGSEPAKDW